MIEEWRPVEGWEGFYEVSSLARVRRLPREVRTCGIKRIFTVRICRGGVVKMSTDKAGYYRADLYNGERRKNSLVHRLFAVAFIPNPDAKPCINHIDGDKKNNSADNLEWCTHIENMQHAFATGLTKTFDVLSGDESPNSKLNSKQVVEIKERLKSGEAIASIFKSYPIKSKSTIAHIRDGHTWKGV
jgi:hypothetical protein